MKILRTSAVLAAAALMTAGCTGVSTGSDSDSGTSASESGGLPVAVPWDEARDQLRGSLEGKTVAYVPISLQFDLTALWSSQFREVFENLGAEYIEDDPASDVDTQIRMIESRINDNVDVLIIQNPDVGVLSQQVTEAHSKGIYVISVNVQGTQSSDAYIGADYVAMADSLARRMVADCEAKGQKEIAIISGFGTDSNSIQADAGWTPVFEDAGMDIVSDQQSNYDPTKANQIATAVLQQHPNLCGFAVIFDVTALGAAEAVDSAGLKGKVGIYNFDASRVWCEALKAGDVTAGVAYNASGIAVAAAYEAQALLLKGAEAGSERVMGFVPHTIVDAKNIDDVPGACYGKS